jgi:hypothetical protein
MKELIYGGILSAIFLASVTALWPFQLGFSQENEFDGGTELESCPSCTGGTRSHHHHIIYTYCTTDDPQDIFPLSFESNEKRANHYHHAHYVCR